MLRDTRKIGDAEFLIKTDLAGRKPFKTIVTVMGESDVVYEAKSNTPEDAFNTHQRIWERLEENI